MSKKILLVDDDYVSYARNLEVSPAGLATWDAPVADGETDWLGYDDGECVSRSSHRRYEYGC